MKNRSQISHHDINRKKHLTTMATHFIHHASRAPGISLRLAIIVLLWIFSPLVVAVTPFYKWVDNEGITHYSQEPPVQGNAQRFVPQVSPGLSAEQAEAALNALRKNATAANESRAQGQDEQARARSERDQMEARERRCAEARERLNGFQNSRRVLVKDDQGEYRRIDDDERAALITQIEAFLQKECQ